jgi:hypothetical protein
VPGDAAQRSLRSRALDAASLKTLLARLPRSVPSGFFEAVDSGNVSGALTLRRKDDGEGAWAGEFELSDASVTVPGLGEPVQVEHAAVSLQGPDFTLRKLKVRDGTQVWEGHLQRRATAPRPLQFHLSTPEITAEQLERLAGSTLPGSRNFIARTLRLEPQAPPWMKARRAEGELRLGALKFGDVTVTQVVARVYWDGRRIDFPLVEARWMDGRFSGRLESRAGTPPQYILLGKLDNALWKGAHFDADIDLRGAGLTGALRGEGSFQARNVSVGEETLRLMSGCWDLQADRAGTRARLRCLEAQAAGEVFAGSAQTGVDGRWTGELAGPRRTWRLGGTLTPLLFELSGH